MKQSANLQDWDHSDFVRSLNESILFSAGSKPLVVFQEAQVDAFLSGRSQKSPLNGWTWRGRKGSGIVKCIQGLGMLQHLRDSRLLPYRLGCNCLYEHPGLKHLLVGQQGSNAPSSFPRLMHINPTMSGPIFMRKSKDSAAPWGVAFAGAEFVVVGKTTVGVEEVWEVVSELISVALKHNMEDESTTPGLEGLPESHIKNGTAKATLFMPATVEGKSTLVEGQAPLDIDRFKAWHMSPQYHGISHHVWCLEDLRIFLFLHRLALTLWIFSFLARRLTMFGWICAFTLFVVTSQMIHISEASGRIYAYYRSKFGKFVMFIIDVFLVVWELGRNLLKIASTIARGLVACLLALPEIVLPRQVISIALAVVDFSSELVRFVIGTVIIGYHGAVEAIVARLPPVPGLTGTVRFILDTAVRVVCKIVAFFFVALATLVFWWYSAEEESPLVQAEARFRELLDQTDAQSNMEMIKLVRGFVFDLRAKNELAMDRRRRARAKGAPECSGERKGGDHACPAALAIAAVKLKRKPSRKEEASISRILFKSGTIRDSLVRTARVMLATEPAKAVSEVAHELMHAAHAGLIWPDEPLIATALQSEGRDPTAENVMWHRCKWVAVAASMIVHRESQPRTMRSFFTVKELYEIFPDAGVCNEIDFRQRRIHPAERCVHCFTQHETDVSSRGTNDGHMKTEGRRPSPKLSACRSAVVKDSRRRRQQPHYEVEDDACRVTLAASREVFDKPNEFPFFHAKARQPKVGPDRARRLAVRLQKINAKCEELARLDKDMAEARASPPQPSPPQPSPPHPAPLHPAPPQPSPPQPSPLQPAPPQPTPPQPASPHPSPEQEERTAPSAHGRENENISTDRSAAQERKARRLKARKERAMEVEAARKQRLQQLQDVVVAADEGTTAASVEEEDDDDETLCIVCMTEQRNACLVHGRTSHQVTCLECANRLKEANMGCPICKRRIDVVIENFTS
eukprot:g3701.t1